MMTQASRRYDFDWEGEGARGTVPAPTAPSLLTATPDNTVPKVTLGWTQGTGVITSVKLYRQVDGGGFALYQTLGVVTSYIDTVVSYGHTYDYKVLDHGPGGDSGFSNVATAVVAVDPTTFATPAGWWKADWASLPDGTTIGSGGNPWTDQSGNGKDGLNGTAALRPIYHTNIANGKPALLFTWKTDFSDQHYLDFSGGADGGSIVPAGDYTVLSVAQPSSLSTRVGGVMIGNAYAGNQCAMIALGPSPVTNSEVFDSTNNQTSSGFADQTDVIGMYSFIRSGGNISFRLNGNDQTTAPGLATNQGHFSFLGASAVPAVQARWGGYLMEVVVYTSALTVTQINSLYNNYFKPRWGLP